MPSRLSRATTFLTNSYEPFAFWWEPLEMCRKLALTGWVLLIPEEFGELDGDSNLAPHKPQIEASARRGVLIRILRGAEKGRVLAAILVCAVFLALHLSIKPMKRYAMVGR